MQRTIRDILDHYPMARLKPRTRQMTDLVFRLLIQSIGDIPLAVLTREHAEEFQLWLINRYSSRHTVNSYLKTVRPPFRWAMRKDPPWIAGDIFRVPLLKVTESRDRIFTPAEFALMRQAADPMWDLRFCLAKMCGLRKAEVLHLRFADVDETKGLLHVQVRKETGSEMFWEPKSKTPRTLPLPDVVAELMAARREQLPPGQPYMNLSDFRYWRIRQMLRTGAMNDRVRSTPDENFHPFKRILLQNRIPHGTFHDLRRTYGTEMAEAGIPQHELAYLMGHSSVDITNRYYIKIQRDRAIERARIAVNRNESIVGFSDDKSTRTSCVARWKSRNVIR
jgi:integrase